MHAARFLLPAISGSLDDSGNPIRAIGPATRTFFVAVGGILDIAANQPDGVYSATFQLTANDQ